jgi:hypothetical protein
VANWVPTFARVRYPDLKPGTDLIYRGSKRRLEYDLVVAPHADSRRRPGVPAPARARGLPPGQPAIA